MANLKNTTINTEMKVSNITDETGTGSPSFSNGLPASALSGQLANSNMPSGSPLQIVTASDSAYRSISAAGQTEYDWIEATINRQRSDSKIMILFAGQYAQSSNTDSTIRLRSSLDGRLSEGDNSSTMLGAWSSGTDHAGSSTWAGDGRYWMPTVNIQFLYTPSDSTSQISIKTVFFSEGSQTFYPNGDGWRGSGQQQHNVQSNMTLMEIA